MIKGSAKQDITIVNNHALNIGTAKYIKLILTNINKPKGKNGQ